MKFEHLNRLLTQTPLMITPQGWSSAYEAFNRYLDGRFNGVTAYDPNRDARNDRFANKAAFIDGNGIGHIHINGALGKNLSNGEKSCYDMSDYNDIEREIDALAAKSPRGYVFHMNTPGGSVRGLSEVAQKIDALKAPKMAWTDDLIASAGYYLVCGCDYIYSTASAEVGCIGTILQTWDLTEYYAKQGVKSDPITNEGATFKSMGYLPALTPDQRAHLQGVVNKLGSEFKNRITNYRNVPEEAMRGQCFFGDEAPGVALTDGVKSYEEAYAAFLARLTK